MGPAAALTSRQVLLAASSRLPAVQRRAVSSFRPRSRSDPDAKNCKGRGNCYMGKSGYNIWGEKDSFDVQMSPFHE